MRTQQETVPCFCSWSQVFGILNRFHMLDECSDQSRQSTKPDPSLIGLGPNPTQLQFSLGNVLNVRSQLFSAEQASLHSLSSHIVLKPHQIVREPKAEVSLEPSHPDNTARTSSTETFLEPSSFPLNLSKVVNLSESLPLLCRTLRSKLNTQRCWCNCS